MADEDGHGREVLQVENMSRVSPRIFWSLTHLSLGPDMLSTLQALLPEVSDWAWYGGRVRGKSEKAKENEAQDYAHAQAQSRPSFSKQGGGRSAASSSSSSSSSGDGGAGAASKRKREAINAASKSSAADSVVMEATIRAAMAKCDTMHASVAAAVAECGIDAPMFLLSNASLSCDTAGAGAGAGEEEEEEDEEVIVQVLRANGVDDETMETWRQDARDTLYRVVWRKLVGGSARLDRALTLSRINSVRRLRALLSCPQQLLLELLLAADPGLLSSFPVESLTDKEGVVPVDADLARAMCQAAVCFVQLCPWADAVEVTLTDSGLMSDAIAEKLRAAASECLCASAFEDAVVRILLSYCTSLLFLFVMSLSISLIHLLLPACILCRDMT
jgi:hypothetical protein